MLPIVLAAGRSQRFIDAGYPRPKPFLNILYKGKECSMLEHVLDTLPADFQPPVIGVPPGFSRFLDQEGKQRHHKATLITIEKTRGQADTLYQLVNNISDQPILVLNCDILFQTKDLITLSRREQDLVLAVQSTINPQMSFVDDPHNPKKFVEKIPISSWGISGAWKFSECGPLRAALHQTLLTVSVEPYLSHSLNLLKGTKGTIIIDPPVDWNTPNSLIASGATIKEIERVVR